MVYFIFFYVAIFIFTLVFSSYVLLLFLLSLIPSINLCSVAFSSISNNFKCGFYSIIIPSKLMSQLELMNWYCLILSSHSSSSSLLSYTLPLIGISIAERLRDRGFDNILNHIGRYH